MLEYYLPIKMLHVTAVILSGTLFFVRGMGIALQQSWPKRAPLRYTTYLIDSLLLLSAFMLMGILQAYPITQHWLTVKVVCLVGYIALGIMAFRDGRSRARRFLFWVAALLLYGFIVSVARFHHPLGVFSWFLG